MRHSRVFLICLCFVIGNFALLFYILHYYGEENLVDEDASRTPKRHGLTVVFYEFEYFENKIADTAQSFLTRFPHNNVLVLSDEPPYPPVELPRSSWIQEFHLNAFPEDHLAGKNLKYILDTEFALIVPDSVLLKRGEKLKQWITLFSTKESIDVLVFAVGHTKGDIGCDGLHFHEKKWTLEFKKVERGSQCRKFEKPVAVLVRVSRLLKLPVPFIRPFFEAFFIQASVRKWRFKFVALGTPLENGDPLFTDEHNRWKHERNAQIRRKDMYKRFGIKKVIHADQHVEWFGCNKNSARCFGSVYQDVPSYIYSGRWTPPCCLEGLRETARYVFRVFDDLGVRYWLEGGSLLGAARYKDIIPWDYDVDLGMYQDDIVKIPFLKKVNIGEKVVDNSGYTWEKAKEGDFFRVQYSQVNHLHVDLFPFFEKSGIMTKNTWMKSHRQDTEFPIHFLQPLEKIDFVGVKASCPNNVRKFLEYKFGAGVIENPQYPNPEKLKMKLGKYSKPI